MSTKQEEGQVKNPKQPERQQLNAAIGGHVMNALGRPKDLHRVQVRHLWDDHYRVNVFLGENAAAARIAHSYFLRTDSDGNMIDAIPKITKEY